MAGVNGGQRHDLRALLSADRRDFLVRSNGDQVQVSDLHGKIVCLYFCASWCESCSQFTPKLIEAYDEISLKGHGFEVVFVSTDENVSAFCGLFSKMPWLAIPFSNSKTLEHLHMLFKVRSIPCLVVLDGNGKVVSEEGVKIVSAYGADGYPFTPEKIEKLRMDEETAKKQQTLQTLLLSPSRDFLISNGGSKVPISELEGSVVGLYFSMNSLQPCMVFTQALIDMYGKLRERGESFKIVLVSVDNDISSFEAGFASMPWFAIPFRDKSLKKLVRYFKIENFPTLVVIDSDGKTLNDNAAELIEEHGFEAYPFSREKVEELVKKEKAREEAQTLELLLVSGEQDYVIRRGGLKVPVSNLIGRNILLYFSAKWSPPCHAFLPKLIEAYHEMKKKDDALEVIFISSDRDHRSFEDFFSGMPWLALPFGDERKEILSRRIKLPGLPSLVAIGPTGHIINKEARDLVTVHGAEAYPFTGERVKDLAAQMEEKAKGWPERINHGLHEEHELQRTHREVYYRCDGCEEWGHWWSFYCQECDFDLHPECALEEEKGMYVEGHDKEWK